jgi:hypothetical protein
LWPIILAVTLWLGFDGGWMTRHFVQLGMMLFFWMLAGINLLQKIKKQ